MTLRILHTSDWHLGQNFYGNSRAKEHLAFIDWLLQQVVKQQIDAIIVAGDIFDTGTPPSYARELYFDFIVKLHQLNCPLILLAGNHDSVAMLGESQTLLAKLGAQVIVKASSLAEDNRQIVHITNKNGEQAAVCAIPFIRPRDVIHSKSGQAIQDKQQQLQQAIVEHYQTLADEAKQRYGDDCTIIATGHLTTVGASLSESVRDIYIGTLEAFPANCFPTVDYIALGHIHRAQTVAKTEHIRYSGSPIPLSFDECQQQKSVNIVEFSQGKLASVQALAVPCFQPMAMLKSDLDSLTEDVEALLQQHQSSLVDNNRIWLDIELKNSDYLTDLTKRVAQLVEQYPIDVLLVRRSKTQAQKTWREHDKTTLAELSLPEVFATRLAQEDWQTEQDLARKQRLESLFLAISSVAIADDEESASAGESI